MDEVVEWMFVNQKEDGVFGFIYNDYKYDNFVLDVNEFVCILVVFDWEMVIVGDICMDFGIIFVYWIEFVEVKFMQLVVGNLIWFLGNFNWVEVVECYQ